MDIKKGGFEVTHWPEEMHLLGLVDVGSHRASITVEFDLDDERAKRMIEAHENHERFAVRIRLTLGVQQTAIANVVDVVEHESAKRVAIALECWWPGEKRPLHPMAAILR